MIILKVIITFRTKTGTNGLTMELNNGNHDHNEKCKKNVADVCIACTVFNTQDILSTDLRSSCASAK